MSNGINVDDLTLGQVKEIQAMRTLNKDAVCPCPYASNGFVGVPIMVRSVTMIYVGVLESVHANEIVLRCTSWIAETGRWQQFIEKGEISECEPYPDDEPIIIGRGAILDAVKWKSPLPRKQK